MSADVDRKNVAALLDLVCVRKSKCTACGAVIWFVRPLTPKKQPLIAMTTEATNHFSTKCGGSTR